MITNADEAALAEKPRQALSINVPSRGLKPALYLSLLLSVVSFINYCVEKHHEKLNPAVRTYALKNSKNAFNLYFKSGRGWFSSKDKTVYLELDALISSNIGSINAQTFDPLNYQSEVLGGNFKTVPVFFATMPIAHKGQKAIMPVGSHPYYFTMQLSDPDYIVTINNTAQSFFDTTEWLYLKVRYNDGTNSSNYCMVECRLQKK